MIATLFKFMESLVNGLFNFFIAILTIITTPLQALIDSYFPSLNEFASNIGPFFSLINDEWIPWIKDLTFLPQWAFNLVIAYIVFKYAVMLGANIIKLVMKYWEVLV